MEEDMDKFLEREEKRLVKENQILDEQILELEKTAHKLATEVTAKQATLKTISRRKRMSEVNISPEKMWLAENKKQVKKICDAKQKLDETSINTSAGSPPCKRRLLYDNPNEESWKDNSSNKTIMQHFPICDESQPCTSQESNESFMMCSIGHKDNLDDLVLSAPEKSKMTVMDNRGTTLSGNVLGKWIQCTMCKKNQRRTPQKIRPSEKDPTEDEWVCKKCTRTNVLTKCNLCEKLTGDKFIMDFSKEKYNLNSNYVKKSIEILDGHSPKCQICSTCDKKLLKRSMSNCVLCQKVCARRELRQIKGPFLLSDDLV